MTTDFDIVELCAGTAAVSLAALGAPPFPCSRIGSKRGYAHAILRELGVVRGSARRALLVEADPIVADALRGLFADPEGTVAALRRALDPGRGLSAEEIWRSAARGESPAHAGARAIVRMAGARGGVGGFKGRHRLRPSVDGFIPSRSSIIARAEAFVPHRGRATVICDRVERVPPEICPPTKVYIDPPYAGRQGYAERMTELPADLARRWASVGHCVAVSEASPLDGGRCACLTAERRGQSRVSLTTSQEEWLTVYVPGAVRK